MDDRANIAFAALPERLYVVQDGQIIYQVSPLHWKINKSLDLEFQELAYISNALDPSIFWRNKLASLEATLVRNYDPLN